MSLTYKFKLKRKPKVIKAMNSTPLCQLAIGTFHAELEQLARASQPKANLMPCITFFFFCFTFIRERVTGGSLNFVRSRDGNIKTMSKTIGYRSINPLSMHYYVYVRSNPLSTAIVAINTLLLARGTACCYSNCSTEMCRHHRRKPYTKYSCPSEQ